MNQKQRVRYEIRFESRWLPYAGFFTALAIFLLCVAYFGFGSIEGAGTAFSALILPLALLSGFGILLQGFKVKFVPLYGVIGALYCLCMVLRAFSFPGALVAVVWYILTAVVFLISTLDVFPLKALASLMFLMPAVYRLAFVDTQLYFTPKDYKGFLWEAAALSGLVAFAAFSLCLKRRAKSNRRQPEKKPAEV